MWRLHYFMHLMKEKKGIGVVEVILILVENLALYIACLEGEKSLKNKLYVRHTQ